MISILIPIYNTFCKELIDNLHAQFMAEGQPFEIIAMEDGSTQHILDNEQACAALSFARHVIVKANIGRSAIRNRLAHAAQYKWILFMDCDSGIEHPDFAHRYLTQATRLERENKDNSTILCGGRVYHPKEAYDRCYRLHWTIGNYREPSARHPNPLKPFLSNNFLMTRQAFLSVQFQENLREYGHEDTLFGFEAQRRHMVIDYIYNPVVHLQLDDNPHFLEKFRHSVHNLVYIGNQYLTADERKQIKLLDTANKLKKWHLLCVIQWLSPLLEPIIKRQLFSSYPRLILFDFYKIMLICKENLS